MGLRGANSSVYEIDPGALKPSLICFQDIANPHDLAISPHGDAVYVAEIGDKGKKYKLHKYEVVNPVDESF